MSEPEEGGGESVDEDVAKSTEWPRGRKETEFTWTGRLMTSETGRLKNAPRGGG